MSLCPAWTRFRPWAAEALVALLGAGCGGTGDRAAPPPAESVATVELPASSARGVFAYADTSGRRLLTLSAPVQPDSLVEAICQSGARLRVRFARHQPASPNDDGRRRAVNFDHDEGGLFDVAEGAARPDETCFLAPPGPARVPRPPADSSCSAADGARLARARGRQPVSCLRIATVDDRTEVLAVEFERRADSALASLVLADPDTVTFLDFPAAPGPEGDTWRVGDGGVFDPRAFTVLLVLTGPAEKGIGVSWGGEEGEALVFAVTGAARGTFALVARDYRYMIY